MKLDGAAEKSLSKVVRNASRTIALVGLPNSGKTSYLAGMGKILRGPQFAGRWQIVGSGEDIFQHVQDLLRSDNEGRAWEATDPLTAPKPLNLFTAKRKGWLHWHASAFDTSGEHYLAMGGGLETSSDSVAGHYVAVLRDRVLPKCPGMLVLMDATLSPNELADQVNLYCLLFNRIHGFKHDTAAAEGREPLVRSQPRIVRVPIALALTKVDMLEGVDVRLRSEECAYLRYLRSKDISLADSGLVNASGPVVGYRIKAAVFLDQQKHPDPMEAQAVIEDYVAFRMHALAEMVASMRTSGMYDVRLFPVSAWGRRLEISQDGIETRPKIEDIAPSGILPPLFWLMDRVYLARLQRTVTRSLKMAVAFLLVLLALGPGMFWILYGVAKSLLEKGSVESAVSVLAVADKHPYTQFVQKHWEQRSQQRLAELHLSVARAYARKGARFKATGMLNQARELLSDPRAFDELEAQFLQSQLYDDARNGVSNETLWESAKPWLVIQLRRGAATYSQSVQSIAEMLQNGGFNHDVWREFATSTLANSSKLTNQDSSMCREMLARTYLEDTGAPARYESGPTTAILGYVESARLADLNAQQSGSPDLMQRCRTRFVDLGVVVMSRYFKEAKEDVTNHSPDAARQAWANALKITQGCLMIADDFRVRSLDLAWQLKTLGESSVAAQPELADLSFSCVLTILTNVEGPQDKIQEVAYASMFLAMDQVKPDLDKLRREELLNGAVRLWLDHQPAPDATAGQLESTLSEMIRKGRITQAEADHFAVGWRVPLQVFNKYLETGEVDKAADTLAGLLNDKTFPDDRMRRSIIRLADKARHWVPSSTPRLANLPEEAIQQLHDKAAGMSLAEEKQILAVLLVRSKLSQLSQLPIEKATQTDRLRLAGEAAKLWNESPSVAVDLRISMGETIADLLDKGCLAIETVPQFNVGHYIAKALQTKYQEKDFTRAIDLLSRCIAQPGVVTAPEAHDLIVAIFNASVETFGRQRLDVGTVIAREAGIKKLSDAARDTEMSSKINKLMEHLDLVKDMVLVRKNGCFFFIDRQGVSVDQYHKFDKALPTEDPAFKSFYSGNMNISPVVMVTQTQAAAFAKASGKRLPRLSELECLSESLAELPAEKMNVDHGPMSKTKILAPGAFPDDNVAGVIDLAGNVREWCADVNADRKVAVFGNSWFAKQKKEWWKDADCWISPAEKDSHTGFRCVAEVLPDGLGLSVPQGSSTTEPTQP